MREWIVELLENLDDLKDIWEIGAKESKVFPNKINPNKTHFVVRDNGKIIAFQSFQIRKNVSRSGFTYVLPEYRRKGVMSALLKKRFEYMKDHGCILLKSVCVPESRPFFEKKGAILTKESSQGKVEFAHFDLDLETL